MNKIQPRKIEKIVCPKCRELMLKVYPWSSIGVTPGKQIPACGRCINKYNKGTLARKIAGRDL